MPGSMELGLHLLHPVYPLVEAKRTHQIVVKRLAFFNYQEHFPVLARRKPRLLLRLSGCQLLRLATRALAGVLFQEPPRFTRLEPLPFAHSEGHNSCAKLQPGPTHKPTHDCLPPVPIPPFPIYTTDIYPHPKHIERCAFIYPGYIRAAAPHRTGIKKTR